MSSAANAPSAQPSFVTLGYLVSSIVLVCLSTVAVALRLYSNYLSRSYFHFTSDDYLILASLLVTWGAMIQVIIAGAVGGIRTVKGSNPAETAVFFLKVIWSSSFLLATASSCVKLSIVAFYCRLFQPIKRFVLACRIHMVVIVLWGLTWILGQIFSYWPVSGAWSLTQSTQDLRINESVFFDAVFGIGIGLDLITLCLPLTVIRTLHMPRARQWKVAGIFWLGAFVVIAAAVRFYYSYEEVSKAQDTATSNNHTRTVADAAIWSQVELNCAIIAACLPLYAPLIPKVKSLDSNIRSALDKISLRSFGTGSSRSQSRDGSQTRDTEDDRTGSQSLGAGIVRVEHTLQIESSKGASSINSDHVPKEWDVHQSSSPV